MNKSSKKSIQQFLNMACKYFKLKFVDNKNLEQVR